MVGRITLAISTLSVVPTHSMQYTLLPIKTPAKLIRFKEILYRELQIHPKNALVNWKTITKEKAEGGLVIRSASTKNLVLLTNLAWRLLNNQSDPWPQLI